MKNQIGLLVLLPLVSLILSGCLDRSGNYAGYVSQLSGAENSQHPIAIVVGKLSSGDGGNSIHCDVSETAKTPFLSRSFDIVLSSKIALVEHLTRSLPSLSLKKDKNSNCWRSVTPKAFACLDSTGFQFQVDLNNHEQVRFWTDKGASLPRSPVDANSQTFTVDQLRSMSVRGNFDNRVEYEALIQAKRQADIAALSLGPKLSVNGMMNVYTGGLTGLLTGSITELAPFLFPSNWYAAKSSERTAQAATTAAALLKVDIALQVETLAAAVSRDKGILDSYESLIGETEPIREQISVRERLGQFPQGSTNNIDSILSQAKQDSIAILQTIGDEKRSLAVMVGIGNLDAITAIDWSTDPNPLNSPLKINTSTMLERAISESLEIAQIQSLMEAGQMKVQQADWSWLDPSGNPATGIGLANGAGISLSKSQLRSLQIHSEQIDSLIQQRTLGAAQSLQTALQSYSVTTSTLQINEDRKNQMFDKIGLGFTVDFFGLVQVLQDDLKSKVDVQNAVASYRIAKASVNRLLMQGPYAHIK